MFFLLHRTASPSPLGFASAKIYTELWRRRDLVCLTDLRDTWDFETPGIGRQERDVQLKLFMGTL